jgi:sugar phosphate permease
LFGVSFPADLPPSAFILFKIPAYLMVMVGGMFVVFSSTALITWGPTFANRYHNLNVAQASSWMGGLVLVGSVGGVLVGSYAADTLQARWVLAAR